VSSTLIQTVFLVIVLPKNTKYSAQESSQSFLGGLYMSEYLSTMILHPANQPCVTPLTAKVVPWNSRSNIKLIYNSGLCNDMGEVSFMLQAYLRSFVRHGGQDW